MVYNQRFVISVLVNGEVQKEFNDGTVELPFGGEYVIRLRNKHKNRRAVCKLFVDGEERSNNGYVIPPRSHVDIHNDSYRQSFKLVASDSVEAQDEGKDKDNTERNNGVIEGQFYLEKEQPVVKEIHHHHDHYYPAPKPRPYPWHHPWRYYGSTGGYAQPKGTGEYSGSLGADGLKMSDATGDVRSASASSPDDASLKDVQCSASSETLGFAGNVSESASIAKSGLRREVKRSRKRETEAGVTVDAGFKGQTYMAVSIDLEDEFVPVKLLLRGYEGNVMEAAEVVASSTKRGRYCSNCGKKYKKKDNFCNQCGHKF